LAFIFKTILQSGGSIINKETNTQLNKADRNNRGTSGKLGPLVTQTNLLTRSALSSSDYSTHSGCVVALFQWKLTNPSAIDITNSFYESGQCSVWPCGP